MTSADAATNIVVTTTQDPNLSFSLVGLRDAIDQANANPLSDSTITFAPSLAGKTITLHAGELSITNYVRFVGPGAGSLTISGNDASRIFHIIGPGGGKRVFPLQVFVSGLTLAHAASPANQGGGAIDAEGATSVFIQDSVISNSHAAVGAAIGMSGVWATDIFDKYDCFGDLTVARSVISGNSATLSGGGILAGYCTRTHVYDSTIVGNSAYDYGGGLFAGTAFYLQVDTSLIAGNMVGGQASPLMGGAGIAVNNIHDGTVIRNSTITGNIALAEGGGLAVLDTIGNTRIYSSTIAGNSGYSFAGQGIGSAGGTVTLVNSIVANNSSGFDDEDLAGTFSSDHSLIKTPGSSALVSGSGNIFSQDPLLGPLRDNDGPTRTMLPAIASPVIDTGSADTAVDERGLSRAAGPGYDMGAVERQYPEQLVFRAAFEPL
jgi:predicted outer membrane repeat protein